MSRQFDARQHALKCASREEALQLFLDFLDISADEFEDCEGISAEEYIFGREGDAE